VDGLLRPRDGTAAVEQSKRQAQIFTGSDPG
jgi:hypothetical protein